MVSNRGNASLDRRQSTVIGKGLITAWLLHKALMQLHSKQFGRGVLAALGGFVRKRKLVEFIYQNSVCGLQAYTLTDLTDSTDIRETWDF